MITEDKYLDYDYIDLRLRELDKVRDGTLHYYLRRSDNYPKSKSLYVNFYYIKNGKKIRPNKGLRISDHYLERDDWIQFIVKTGKELKSGKKKNFKECLQCVINRTLIKAKYFE